MAEEERERRADVTWEDLKSGSTLKFTMWLANLIRHSMLGDSPPMSARVIVVGSSRRGFVVIDGFTLKYRAGMKLERDGTKVFAIQLRYEPPGQEYADVLTIEVPLDQVPGEVLREHMQDMVS